MALKENKKSKKPSKLKGAKNALQFASDKFRSSKAGGGTTLSALKAGIQEYSEKGKAASIAESGRVGNVGEFFKGAGFENLGEILGSLFDRSATKEEIDAAKESLGMKKEEVKKEPKEPKKKEPVDKPYVLKQSAEILKKIDALGKSIISIDQKLDYIAERVSPKIINAKEEGGKSINVIQYDPLAPAGEQFRGISDSGKLSVKKISKEYMKSAVMQASLLSKSLPEKGKVSKFTDPKEKNFTEEFKKDPILLLKKDMNDNFEKVFKLLEKQNDAIEQSADNSGGGMFGVSLGGRRRGRAGRTRSRPPRPTPRPPVTPGAGTGAGAATRTAGTVVARAAGTAVATATGAAGAGAAATGAAGAGAAATGANATGAAATRWKLFLNFVKRRSPKLFAKVGARLAAAAGMAVVPLAGWVGSILTIVGSLSLAWELYTLWQEFSAVGDVEESFQSIDKLKDLPSEEQDQITAYLKQYTLLGNFNEDPNRFQLIQENGKNIGFSYSPGPIVPFEGQEPELEKIKQKAGGDLDKIDKKYKVKPFEDAKKDKMKVDESTSTATPPQEKGIFATSVSAVKSFFGFGEEATGGEAAGEEGIPKPKGSTDVLSGGSVSIPSSEEDIKKMIIGHEGVRYRPYKDSRGLWTVGVGHLIGNGTSLPPAWDRQFTESEVLGLFEKDYEEHRRAAENIPGFNKMNIAGKAALTDLTFNMGPHWIKKWPNTAKKLEAGDFEGVASDLEQSKWYTQVGNRAPKIVGLMRKAGDDSIAMSEKRGGVIPSQSGSESNAGMVIPSQSGDAAAATPTAPGMMSQESNLTITNGATTVQAKPGTPIAEDPYWGFEGHAGSGSEGKRGMAIPSQSGSESNKGMVIPSQSGTESNKGMVIPSQSGSESNKGMVIPSQTAAVAPVQSKSGAEIDNGSKALDAAKTESAAPVVVNNTTVQQGKSSSPPMGGSSLPPAKPRSAESSFGRAIAKDFSHPTAFTTVGTI
jgi:lysozyme